MKFAFLWYFWSKEDQITVERHLPGFDSTTDSTFLGTFSKKEVNFNKSEIEAQKISIKLFHKCKFKNSIWSPRGKWRQIQILTAYLFLN